MRCMTDELRSDLCICEHYAGLITQLLQEIKRSEPRRAGTRRDEFKVSHNRGVPNFPASRSCHKNVLCRLK